MGLKPQIKKIFWGKDVTDVEEIYNKAEKREIYLKHKKKGNADIAVVEKDKNVKFKSDFSELKDQLAKLQGKLEVQESLLKERDEEIERIRAEGSRMKNEAEKRMNEVKPGERQHPSQWACWSCGEVGHFRQDCKMQSK